jgi:cell wall-associated NlpC family hydrolase
MTKKLTILLVFVSLFVLILSQPTQASSLSDSLLKTGSRGSNVVQLQTELNNLGYNVGTTDGIFGVKTQAKVVAFQKAEALRADGIVGLITANTLNKAYLKNPRTYKVNALIATAEKYLGVPYQWGGESPITGFDCSGFVQYVFAQYGITLPRVSRAQYTMGTAINFTDLQPGDLIFFSMEMNQIVNHVGIYIGNGQFINASCSKGVTIYPIGPYWESVEFGARRVF